MRKNPVLLIKTLVIGIFVLFLGLAVQPSVATVQPIEESVEVEPKDHLFQTIIDIANNPDVKNLLLQYNNDLFRFDIHRSVYRKLLFNNPRLLFNIFFTKPSMTVDYLNFCYNNGMEINSIIGEEKVLEIKQSIEIKDYGHFKELKNIITNNGELSSKILSLSEMNFNEFICLILLLIMIPILVIADPFITLYDYSIENSKLSTFIIASFGLVVINIFWLPVFVLFIHVFDC